MRDEIQKLRPADKCHNVEIVFGRDVAKEFGAQEKAVRAREEAKADEGWGKEISGPIARKAA